MSPSRLSTEAQPPPATPRLGALPAHSGSRLARDTPWWSPRTRYSFLHIRGEASPPHGRMWSTHSRALDFPRPDRLRRGGALPAASTARNQWLPGRDGSDNERPSMAIPWSKTYRAEGHTFRKFRDGDHAWPDFESRIFDADHSHKCPTCVHRTPPRQGSCPAGDIIRPHLLTTAIGQASSAPMSARAATSTWAWASSRWLTGQRWSDGFAVERYFRLR